MTLEAAITHMGLQDELDEQCVAILRAITLRPIRCDELAWFLREHGLAVQNALDSTVTGSLIDLVVDPQTPSELAAAIRDLLQHVYHRGSKLVITTDAPIALQTQQVISALLGLQIISSEVADAFYALGGGRPFANIEAEDVAVAKGNLIRREAARAAYNTVVAYLNDMHSQAALLLDQDCTASEIMALIPGAD